MWTQASQDKQRLYSPRPLDLPRFIASRAHPSSTCVQSFGHSEYRLVSLDTDKGQLSSSLAYYHSDFVKCPVIHWALCASTPGQNESFTLGENSQSLVNCVVKGRCPPVLCSLIESRAPVTLPRCVARWMASHDSLQMMMQWHRT